MPRTENRIVSIDKLPRALSRSDDIFVPSKRVLQARRSRTNRISAKIPLINKEETVGEQTGQLLRTFRQDYGMSVEDFAEHCGISVVTLLRFEAGYLQYLLPKVVVGLITGLGMVTVNDQRVEQLDKGLMQLLDPDTDPLIRRQVIDTYEEIKNTREERRRLETSGQSNVTAEKAVHYSVADGMETLDREALKNCTVSDILKYLRDRAGFTAKELAEKSQISRSYVHQLEAGSKPLTTATLERLIRAYELSVNDPVINLISARMANPLPTDISANAYEEVILGKFHLKESSEGDKSIKVPSQERRVPDKRKTQTRR